MARSRFPDRSRSRTQRTARPSVRLLVALGIFGALVACDSPKAALQPDDPGLSRGSIPEDGRLVQAGGQIFRFETYGNEPFWTDTLQMHQVISAAVDPLTALAVGLRVDADALPPGILDQVDLTDPATTVALLRLNAVVGLMGRFDQDENLTGIGTTCALCHSDVDNSVMPGIGRRLDGWPNRDLNVGAILALSPALEHLRSTLLQWGPGRFDPRFFVVERSDGTNPTLIQPAYGQEGIFRQTWTGDGDLRYWNNYVAVTQMRGQGVFTDPRIGVFVAHRGRNLVQPALRPLELYQRTLRAPRPPAGSFDPQLANDGEALFNNKAQCATCHIPPLFTDANIRLHAPEAIGRDPAVARLSPTGMYRTQQLPGLWHRAPYFHDGSAADLLAVVNHYDEHFNLGLTAEEKIRLIEYLKSL